ncbi:hypothetical protein F3N43_13910 [Alkalilimnicola sp. S0819]|nr:hypothetical protein F3N43_13910 [Alkalilimnicola sp. S0819]MPQ17724.1 hypothetical protein [Alkalilimnicola sp. S0819]
MHQWTWTDGWLLMAVFMAKQGEPAELHEIIAAADAMNHAIPTPSELSSAFTKLAQCEILEPVGDRYVVSERHLSGVATAYSGKGGLVRTPDKGLKWLLETSHTPSTAEQVVVLAAKFRHAFKQYQARLKEA